MSGKDFLIGLFVGSVLMVASVRDHLSKKSSKGNRKFGL